MQSESGEPLFNKKSQAIILSLIALVIISLILFRNLLFQSTYILKSFGELSIDPSIAFNNNKPTFIEFYAEWCEVCKEMAPEVSVLKDKYEKDINFVFLNVDNQKWDHYIRKFGVNGIPQVNLFDNEGNLVSTFVGKQKEVILRESLADLAIEAKPHKEILNSEFSALRENQIKEVSPRSHG